MFTFSLSKLEAEYSFNVLAAGLEVTLVAVLLPLGDDENSSKHILALEMTVFF
jgi:hypothetical protein